jgi:hypothetical protein
MTRARNNRPGQPTPPDPCPITVVASGRNPYGLMGTRGGLTDRPGTLISIRASAGRVFAYVADLPRHGEWAGHGLEVTKSGDGAVTDLTPDTTFAWDSTGALGRVHHRFSLADEGDSTTLSKGAEVVDPTFLAKITSWKLSKDIPNGIHSDLVNIKARLEGPGA